MSSAWVGGGAWTYRAASGAWAQNEAEAMLPMQHASASTNPLKALTMTSVAHSVSTPACFPLGETYGLY